MLMFVLIHSPLLSSKLFLELKQVAYCFDESGLNKFVLPVWNTLNRMYKDLHPTHAKLNWFSVILCRWLVLVACFRWEYNAHHKISEHNEYNECIILHVSINHGINIVGLYLLVSVSPVETRHPCTSIFLACSEFGFGSNWNSVCVHLLFLFYVEYLTKSIDFFFFLQWEHRYSIKR